MKALFHVEFRSSWCVEIWRRGVVERKRRRSSVTIAKETTRKASRATVATTVAVTRAVDGQHTDETDVVLTFTKRPLSYNHRQRAVNKSYKKKSSQLKSLPSAAADQSQNKERLSSCSARVSNAKGQQPDFGLDLEGDDQSFFGLIQQRSTSSPNALR